MTAPDRGLQLLHRLNLIGQLLPEADELMEFVNAARHQESAGPVLYPDLFRRGEKRLRAAAELCSAALAFRAAYEDLQEATREEADPDADRAAQVLLDRWADRARAGGGS